MLKRGTLEYNAGAEYDINKAVTVSAGWQSTNYGLSEESMEDKSFVVSSNSVGLGTKIQLSDKMALNVAYFHTFYKHKKTTEKVSEQLNYTATYVFVGVCCRNNGNLFCLYYYSVLKNILSLHKISCTRQFESKLSLRSFALSLH